MTKNRREWRKVLRTLESIHLVSKFATSSATTATRGGGHRKVRRRLFLNEEKLRDLPETCIFFKNLKHFDVQNDICAIGRVGFQKAEPAF